MTAKFLASLNLTPKKALLLIAALALVTSALSFGSYALSEKDLTGRRGPVAFVPKDYRATFLHYRRPLAIGGAALFILVVSGWAGSEAVARTWQKRRNEELALNKIVIRIAPRLEDRNRWQVAADLWRALHSTLLRSARDTWLGAGLHVSLEMVQAAGDRITFYLWTPRPLAQTLVRQLRATYAGLEIDVLTPQIGDRVEDYLDRVPADTPWLWADLGLGREPWRPLRTDFALSPLAPVLSTLEGLSAGVELAAIHLLLRPAQDWQAGGAQFAARGRGDNLPAGQPRPRLSPQDRTRLRKIEQKAEGTGYDLCLRLLVAGPGPDAGANLERLIRVYDQYADDNRLVVRRQGDQNELNRIKNRFFPAGWGPSVVGDVELAALAHLPGGDLDSVNIERAGVQLLRPSPISFAGSAEARLVLGLGQTGAVPAEGEAESLSFMPEVGIPLQDTRCHFHVIGPTGVGKSTLLLRMVWQYLANFPEAAIWLQEPHQDLTHKVVERVPLWREKDLIWLDVMDPVRVIGINPLDAPPGADLGMVVADVMGIIRKAMGANWDGAVQMQEILENALLAVIAGEKQPTMIHLFKLLTDPDYRYNLTATLDDPIAAPYWQSLEDRKEKELDQMFSVPRRRINAFIRNPVVRRIIAQPRSTVDFRQAIDHGKVILVQLDGSMGASNRTFVGSMMMYKLFGTVMSRMDIPEADRKQVAICVDEFQTFVGQSSQEFADILEQARKMGASLTLAHQHLGQLGDLVGSVANNTGTKVVFRAEASDAPTFLKWLPELSSMEALTKMRNFWCYVRPLVNGSPQPVCTLKTYGAPPILDPEVELRSGRRGEPDPLPPHPGGDVLKQIERLRALPSDNDRKNELRQLRPQDWQVYLAGRRYHDALRRNQLIEKPELLPNKMERIRALVRLGYGTPHYETEALVENVLRS